jgi:hypothetical protein
MQACDQASLTHSVFGAIAALPALTRLDIGYCTQLTESAFAALARSRTLTELSTHGCD